MSCFNSFVPWGFEYGLADNLTTNIQTLTACGYDPLCYISTANLGFTPYTTQALIQAKYGGFTMLLEAVDDDQPSQQVLAGDALAVLNSVIQNVTTEINGYLSSIYPTPLMQTGTVAIFQITGVSTDGNGTVTSIKMLSNGNYATAPSGTNMPTYMRFIEPLANCQAWGDGWQQCQQGTGLSLTVIYVQVPFVDESGQTPNATQVSMVTPPVISDGGTNYQMGQILVLTGGTSYVPAKVREAAISLICYDLDKRRLAPDEYNRFQPERDRWRGKKDEDGLLLKIGKDEQELDGTFKRFFSPVSMWGNKSVLFGANSL